MGWIRRYFTDLIVAHVDGVRAIAGLPWLFVLLIGWEFAQHIAEVRSGMFESLATAKAVQYDGARLALGWVKMLSVYVGGFFVIRYLVRRDHVRPVAPLGAAIVRYIPYIGYSLILFALVLYAPQIVPGPNFQTLRAGVGLSQVFVEPLLMLWIVSAATDGVVRSPSQSARCTGLLYFWALALFFVGRLPVNIVHQLLNRYAIGQEQAVVWSMMVVDAAAAGLIIAVIPAIYVRIARLIEERRSRSS
ncbi:MAG: hypothetical protein JSR79_11380 [Proteobacteria bacterium]|nr:hypothetical protein [Pseudomonadota bacterium]